MSRSPRDSEREPEATPSDRERLRLTFGTDADRYDRIRPGYPRQLFDDLAEMACIGPGCRVLEIGVGTGQATLSLAERGCQLIGVELSPALAGCREAQADPTPERDHRRRRVRGLVAAT